MESNVIVNNVIAFAEIILTLSLYFRESENGVANYYFPIIKKSLLIAVLAGTFFSLFFILYVNFINPYYFEEIAIIEVDKLRKSGYDENVVRKTLRIIGAAQGYHLKEIFITLSVLIRTLAVSLILAPTFIRFQKKLNPS